MFHPCTTFFTLGAFRETAEIKASIEMIARLVEHLEDRRIDSETPSGAQSWRRVDSIKSGLTWRRVLSKGPGCPDGMQTTPPAGLGAVTLVEGSSFCISLQKGDIFPHHPHGFFHRDTRVLSRWCLTINGEQLEPPGAWNPSPFRGTYIGRAVRADGRADSPLTVERRRSSADAKWGPEFWRTSRSTTTPFSRPLATSSSPWTRISLTSLKSRTGDSIGSGSRCAAPTMDR